IWEGGTWRGGVWENGTWEDGTWEGGVWKGGSWKGGLQSARGPYGVYVSAGGAAVIGCKTKTIAEWDEWFAGSDEYETPRGTEKFALIQAQYEAIKAYHNYMTKWKEEHQS